jgi:hypothetical protein
MRIRELLETKNFNHKQFSSPKEGGGREINYDLAEDLIHYMNENDNVYRRHVYPIVAKCIDMLDAKKPTKPNIFEPVVKECYRNYINEFPIRELSDNLEDELFKEICKKMYETVCQHHADGKFKD